MRMLKEKSCLNCSTLYQPTGSCSKFCSLECRDIVYAPRRYEVLINHRIKKGVKVGVGKGGTTGSGKDNHMWKNGISVFGNNRSRIKKERRYCEHCEKDLIDATHYMWVIHHIDHNRFNNPEDGSNWKLLCKRCHQIEHECWKGYEGATTILVRLPNGRYSNPNRSTTQESGKCETP